MASRFEQKISLQYKNVVTTKPTQVIYLFVINTQTFSELIHELLYLLNILYTAFLINPTLVAFFLFTLESLVTFANKGLITYNFQTFFSSLVKQNKKGKNCAVFCFAGKRKLLFYILRCDCEAKNL